MNIPHPSLFLSNDNFIFGLGLGRIRETGKGTSCEKIYDELGWESLDLRQWSRYLVFFYKIINYVTLDYTRSPIPQCLESNYSLCR